MLPAVAWPGTSHVEEEGLQVEAQLSCTGYLLAPQGANFPLGVGHWPILVIGILLWKSEVQPGSPGPGEGLNSSTPRAVRFCVMTSHLPIYLII